MGVNHHQKYLGLNVSWKGWLQPKSTQKLNLMLSELSSAPPKPHQRCKILNIYLLPKLTHELVLGNVHRNTLKRIDVMVRTEVKWRLRLPKDCPPGYLHAKTEDGGLGISNTSSKIPLLQRTRLQNLLSHKEPIYRDVMNMKLFKTTAQSIGLPCRVGKEIISLVSEEKQALAKLLRTSVDVQELIMEEVDKASHLWMHPNGYFHVSICVEFNLASKKVQRNHQSRTKHKMQRTLPRTENTESYITTLWNNPCQM